MNLLCFLVSIMESKKETSRLHSYLCNLFLFLYYNYLHAHFIRPYRVHVRLMVIGLL